MLTAAGRAGTTTADADCNGAFGVLRSGSLPQPPGVQGGPLPLCTASSSSRSTGAQRTSAGCRTGDLSVRSG